MPTLRSTAAALTLGALTLPAIAHADDGATLLQDAQKAADNCAAVSESCAQQMQNAAGVLVFPDVLTVQLGVGGSGGHGVLFVDGQPQGVYDLGRASAGLEAGIEEASYVFVVTSEDALKQIEAGEWDLGAEAGLTIVDGANADADSNADVYDYVVTARGLDADIAVNVMKIWPSDETLDGTDS